MRLVAVAGVATYVCPMHPEMVSEEPGHCPTCAMKLLPRQMVERTGDDEHRGHSQHGREHDTHGRPPDAEEGHAHTVPGGIEWDDDIVEVNRITTRSTSTAPADFLVLSRNGITEPNLVWKDTVLLRTGETVDILLDVTYRAPRVSCSPLTVPQVQRFHRGASRRRIRPFWVCNGQNVGRDCCTRKQLRMRMVLRARGSGGTES